MMQHNGDLAFGPLTKAAIISQLLLWREIRLKMVTNV